MFENKQLIDLVEMARQALLLDDWADRGTCVVLDLKSGPFLSSREQARTLLRLLLTQHLADPDSPLYAGTKATS